jgi:hypothetical protein
MVGLIGNLAKGALTKPKQQKVTPKQLVKDTGDKKERSKPKGSLVPSPSGAIVKIIDVKAPVKKDFVTGGDPALEQMKIINTKTFDIIKALKGQQVAKKKRAKSKKNLFQWMSRKNREEGREEKGGGLKIPLVGKIATGAGNLLGAILKILAILFAGWLTKYLPQIIEAVRKFVDIVVKIVNFVKPIAQLFWDIGKWIVGAGTKLAAMLVGVKPDDATQNSIIQNLNAIQKRFPLLEAAFASFLVYKGLGGIKKIRQPGGKPNIKSKTSNVKPKTSRTTIKTSSKTSNLVRTKHGTSAQRIFDNAIRNGKSVSGANAEVRRAISSGKILSRPDFGLSSRGKDAGKVLKGGPLRSLNRLGLKVLGKGPMKIVSKFARIPIIGPLIVAVTQILSGQPLGKALFMGVGAGLGEVLGGLLAGALGIGTAGFGAVLAPAIMIMASGIGAFVGELLYDGFLGKGWGAAGQKLKDTVVGFFTQTGEIMKSLWNWIMNGGLIELGKTMGKGLVYFLNPAGFWWDMAKKLGNAVKAVTEWLTGALSRFWKLFMDKHSVDVPWALRALTFGVKRIPNLLQWMNPFVTGPLMKDAFFPPSEAELARRDRVASGDEPKRNALGIVLADEHQSDEYIKKRDSGQLPASQNADAISESASYDQAVEAGDTTIISNDGAAIPSGGGGSSLSLIGGSDFYRAAQLNRKKSNLARVWA